MFRESSSILADPLINCRSKEEYFLAVRESMLNIIVQYQWKIEKSFKTIFFLTMRKFFILVTNAKNNSQKTADR